jgi:hypothetical protein
MSYERNFVMVKILAAATAATAVALIGVTSIAAASASARPAIAKSGTERIQVVSSAAGMPASAIAYGVITGGGTASLGTARLGTLALNGGTITVSHKAGKGGTEHFNPRSCLTLVTQPGTFKVVSGTGRFKNLSGHGTYELTFQMVGVKVKGACSDTKPPVAQQEVLRLAGHVRL